MWLLDFCPSQWTGGLGKEELMLVNSKTVTVLHVGGRGNEFLARAGAGAGQDGCGLGLYICECP